MANCWRCGLIVQRKGSRRKARPSFGPEEHWQQRCAAIEGGVRAEACRSEVKDLVGAAGYTRGQVHIDERLPSIFAPAKPATSSILVCLFWCWQAYRRHARNAHSVSPLAGTRRLAVRWPTQLRHSRATVRRRRKRQDNGPRKARGRPGGRAAAGRRPGSCCMSQAEHLTAEQPVQNLALHMHVYPAVHNYCVKT